jgi:exoribonuclease-2
MTSIQNSKSDRAILAAIARQAMIERGLEPDFPPAALRELATIGGPADATDDVRD